MIEIKKAVLYTEGNDILIIEPKEFAEIDSNDIDEGLQAIGQHYSDVKLILFDHKHS